MIKHILILFLFGSCTQFVQNTDDDFFETYTPAGKEEKLSLFFSHNIHGETHPCGCRKFPLGGIPQVYGAIKLEMKDKPYLYVDSGDTFFPSSAIPESIKKSSRFTAEKLAESLDSLGLKIFTPGSYDFALGEEFLVQIAKKHKFKFLISNANKVLKIKHEKVIRIKYGEMNLYFLGIVNPDIMPDKYKYLFADPIESLKKEMAKINKLVDIKNKKIILLSHSGMDFDIQLAKTVKGIPWIIGAHTQSFLKLTRDINETKIVQVLSRNHHLGLISLSPTPMGSDDYKLISVKEDLKDAIKPNPYIAWLDSYKKELDKLQAEEQDATTITNPDTKTPTFSTCLDCHDKQVDFWQGTAHSLGFKTLIDAKAANNSKCIGCHSLGFQDEKGFQTAKTIVTSEKKDFDIDKYWKEFNQKINFKSSVRELSQAKRKEFSKKLVELDEKHQVVENNANIQCLHCHEKTSEHPFDTSSHAKIDYQSKCIACHDGDQSPEWYDKDSKGLAKNLNQKYFEQKLKAVSCPKIEKEE